MQMWGKSLTPWFHCLDDLTWNYPKAYHKRILQDQHTITTAKCNWRIKQTCPLKGECLTENIVYLAKVSAAKVTRRKATLHRHTERSFKERLYKHRNSLRHRSKANATELSKYVWDLRDRNIKEINIEWSILDKAPTYRNGSKTWHFRLLEKFHIIFYKKENLLNKRSEILRHVVTETNSSFPTSRDATGQLRNN